MSDHARFPGSSRRVRKILRDIIATYGTFDEAVKRKLPGSVNHVLDDVGIYSRKFPTSWSNNASFEATAADFYESLQRLPVPPAAQSQKALKDLDITARHLIGAFESFESEQQLPSDDIATAHDQVRTLLAQMRSDREQVAALLANVQQQAQIITVDRNAEHFAREAVEHQEEAEKWLGYTWNWGVATVAATVVNVGIAFFPPRDVAHAVQLSIAKLFVLSVLIAATVWAGRIYRAHRHNVIVNKHRANALATFQVLRDSSSDETTRNAVLIEASRSIYSPQPTGYASIGNGESSTGSIVGFVRDASS